MDDMHSSIGIYISDTVLVLWFSDLILYVSTVQAVPNTNSKAYVADATNDDHKVYPIP